MDDFDRKLKASGKSFQKDLKADSGSRDAWTTSSAAKDVYAREGLERILSTPGENRDQLLVALFKEMTPEERAAQRDGYRLLSEGALQELADEGDSLALEQIGINLIGSKDAASQKKGREILERSFRNEPTPSVAARLINYRVQNGGTRSDCMNLGETAVDHYLDRHSLQEEEPKDGFDMSAVLWMLGVTYDKSASLAREREPYSTHRKAVSGAGERIKKAQPDCSSSGLLVFLITVFVVLCVFAIATNYQPGGEDFGGTVGIIALLLFAIACWTLTGSFWSMVIILGILIGICYGLMDLQLDAKFNVTVMPHALLAIIGLIIIICDRSKYAAWKRSIPQQQANVEKIRKSVAADVAFCRDYCQKRLALVQMLQNKVIANNDALKKINISGYQKIYQDELRWVESTAKAQRIPF